MKCLITTICALLLVGSGIASAQDLTYPGSIWSVAGKGSVAEPGNNVSMTHAEQGIAQGPFSILIETTGVADSKGYDWNRKLVGGLLGRYTFKLHGAVVRANFGYETEKRFVNPRALSGFVYSVDMWAGWTLKGK